MKKNKYLITIILLVTFILSFMSFVFLFSANRVSAEQTSETLEQKMERYTSSDEIQLTDGETIEIKELARRYKNYDYRPSQSLNQDYPVTDVISSIIPLELFYTEGTHVYMGKEYGFIVRTQDDNLEEDGFVAEFLIVDFDFGFIKDDITQGDIENKPKYKIETLLQERVLCKQNENNQWVIYHPWVTDEFNIALVSPYIAANLMNENQVNAYDLGYNIENDGGGIISEGYLEYSMHEKIDYFTIQEKQTLLIKYVFMESVKLAGTVFDAMSATGIVKTALSVITMGQQVKNAVEGYREDIIDAKSSSTINGSQKIFNGEVEKDKQKRGYGYYVREIYILNADEQRGICVAGKESDDENDFQTLSITANEVNQNSRFVFSSGFNVALMSQFGTEILVINDDGEYEFVSEETGLESAYVTHVCDYKVIKTDADNIERIKSVNYQENTNDDIADALLPICLTGQAINYINLSL